MIGTRQAVLSVVCAACTCCVSADEPTILEGHSSVVVDLRFSADGRVLASSSWDGAARLWSLETRETTRTLGHQSTVLGLAMPPMGGGLASASQDIFIWDEQPGQLRRRIKTEDTIYALAYSPDGKLLAAGGIDDVITLWDTETGERQLALRGHDELISDIAFSPDGKSLASGSRDKTIKVWDIKTGALRQTLRGHYHEITSIAFSPNGLALASGSFDQTIRIWNVRSGGTKLTIPLRGSPPKWHKFGFAPRESIEVAFLPDGKSLVASNIDTDVKIWSVQTGNDQGTFKGHSNFVWSLAVSPDGGTVASGDIDGVIWLWNVSESLGGNQAARE